MNQTETCTYTNDGGVPPTIVSSECTTTQSATDTIAIATGTEQIAGNIVAYDPFVDVSIGIAVWFMMVVVIVLAIQKFR